MTAAVQAPDPSQAWILCAFCTIFIRDQPLFGVFAMENQTVLSKINRMKRVGRRSSSQCTSFLTELEGPHCQMRSPPPPFLRPKVADDTSPKIKFIRV